MMGTCVVVHHANSTCTTVFLPCQKPDCSSALPSIRNSTTPPV
jgi:hypothetical protein